MRARSADFWSGLVLGGLGAYIIVTASRWEYLGQDGPGPGFFPLWYGIAMSALSLVLVFSSLRSQTRIDWSDAPRALAAWGAFALMCAAFKLIGFLPAFALLTFFLVAVMYRRPLKVAAAVSAALTAGFYLLFPLALGVKLP
ncbi:MAG TPA: tripartite tricarboxylate transporter TctB family protein [Burkholderiales bacterium]|jgi:putative tricarboxylic transport membrane protein|nr:tripartite tricarboxylate transporter TctB family protein [Burkholderiales bacterium]